MSLGDVASQLRQAREQFPSSRLAEAADAIDQIRHTLAEIGSEQDDALEAYACAEQIADLLEQARQVDATAQAKIETYLSQLGETSGTVPAASAASSPASGSAGSGVSGSGGSPQPATQYPTARDGSHYPDAAASVVDVLPRRVREGEQGEKTTGYVDSELGRPFTSGHDETWSTEIRDRSRTVGIGQRLAGFLSSHVEMKVATMMMREGRQHSELVINHVPCGSEPRAEDETRRRSPLGCHHALERYLSSGYTLTVHGTTQDGNPVTHTYEGKS